MVKRTLTWWYYRKIRKNEEKLDQLREKKSKLLDEVMEKETYKVAKEILDKYGSGIEGFKPKPSTVAASISGKPSSSSSPSAGGGAASSELRRRTRRQLRQHRVRAPKCPSEGTTLTHLSDRANSWL